MTEDTYRLCLFFLSFYETHEQELPKCEGEQSEIGVNLCRFGLCLVGALYQVAIASLGGLWPTVPTNHIPTPTTPAWTHSNPPVWCQTPAPTRTRAHTHTQLIQTLQPTPFSNTDNNWINTLWSSAKAEGCSFIHSNTYMHAHIRKQVHMFTIHIHTRACTHAHTHAGLFGWS